jgi:nitroimidazol reductase NimA-like FMN-containing flavoprotein (pyridoxamine 5'-phosphate oxidase superfamily)
MIPTLYIREGDFVYLHGNRQSALLKAAATGEIICISVFSADGIVVARSGFHCSMNYRSVVLFGPGEAVVREKFEEILDKFVDVLIPGHNQAVRTPTRQELDATAVVRVAIEEASAKIRDGDPIDAKEDLDADVWAGVIPIEIRSLPPVASANLNPGIELPDYLRS